VDLIRHLRFFEAVAHERHFGQAAVSLGMTQPPLSQGIQRLERQLGIRLFERDARGVRITSAGSSLLPLAENLVRLADGFVESAAAWCVEPVLRVGIAADLETLVPALVGAVARTMDEVRPVVAGSVELVDRLKAGELDAVVVRHPGVVDGVVCGPVHTLRTTVTGAAGPVDVWRAGLPLVVPPRRWQPAAHDQLVDSLRRFGHSGKVVEEADSVARHALVAAGRALLLNPDPAGDDSGLPLRARTVQPVPADRQSGLDHDAAATALDSALEALAAAT
jgi:DNA-binding transcriptional LysR family regulator